MRKLLLVLLAFCTIMCIAAEITITKVQQRYPWNGLVDIECNVTGLTNALDNVCFSVSVDILNTTNTIEATNFFVLETKENIQNYKNIQNFIVSTNGTYNLVWNTIADIGKVNSSDVILDITLESLHKGVQLWEGGPYWAETNIGAENPEDYGYYFWWGDTIGYKRSNNKWVASDGSSSNFSFSSSNTPTYGKNYSTLQSQGWITSGGVLAPEYDAARAHWGRHWRMPTKGELQSLIDKCTWTWTTMNGIEGYVVKGKGDYSSSSIFFLQLVTSLGLRLAFWVRLATVGRLFLIRAATTTRGASTSRAATTWAATSATAGAPCAQFQMFTKQRTNVSAFNSLILFPEENIMPTIENSVKIEAHMKPIIEKPIKGNKEKYLSYRLAFRMINNAIKCECYLQAITIEESIMADRFLSCICHINGSKYNFNASVNKALNDLLNLNQGWDNEIKIDGCSLFDKIDLLNKFWYSRCSLLHGIAKSPSGKGPEISAENFIKQAKETAIVGKVLTRWVCRWSKQLITNSDIDKLK